MWLLYYLAWITGYIALAAVTTYWLARLAPRRKGIVIAASLITFALIPTWDVIPSRMAFDARCQEEAGIKIYRTVEGVEGFIADDFGSSVFFNYGYRFFEERISETHYVRVTRGGDGQIAKQEIIAPTARYRTGFRQTNLPWRIVRSEIFIEDTHTGERLGSKVWLQVWPGWVFKMFNLTMTCIGAPGPTGNDYLDFYTKVLKPIHQQHSSTEK